MIPLHWNIAADPLTEPQALQALRGLPVREMFPDWLDVRYLDGDTWLLVNRFRFISPEPDVFPSMDLAPGCETDFASIPRLFWRVLPPDHKHIALGAVVHDQWYRNARIPITKAAADLGLRAMMAGLRCPWWKRQLCYLILRAFGRGFQPRLP